MFINNLINILFFCFIQGSGGTLEEQQLTADSVPIIVEKCIKHVDMHGG